MKKVVPRVMLRSALILALLAGHTAAYACGTSDAESPQSCPHCAQPELASGKNKEATLRELAKAGFPRSVVLERAGKLGLTGDLLKRQHLDRRDVSVRRCLNCDETFLSMGSQNRLCNRCRKRQ